MSAQYAKDSMNFPGRPATGNDASRASRIVACRCALAAICARRPQLGVTEPARTLQARSRLVGNDAFGVRLAAALIAATALAAGIVLALHHPSQPGIALAALALWVAAATRWPRLWLFVLPAVLPAANFAPWTGWIVFDEFDLVFMGAAATGFAALARRACDLGLPGAALYHGTMPRWQLIPVLLCAAAASFAVVHGLTAGSVGSMGWFDEYSGPLNALRVGKGLLYALLLVPVIQHEFRRSGDDALRHVAAGMLAGIGIVVTAVVIERTAYPGLFDFSQPYRTTALFWEMHVGGAAIDGYLALAWPFVAWAVLRSRTPLRWALSAALALLVGYACLTTFSRGLYLAVLGGIGMLTIGLARQPARPTLPPWQQRANVMLVVALLAQVAAVIGTESFMRARVKDSEGDFAKRLVHWQHGVRLLHDSADWSFGRGSGRLPAEFAGSLPEDELPGSAQTVSDVAGAHLILNGPGHIEALAGRYALTQRVPIESLAYRVAFDAHVDKPVRLGVSVCTMHLLYEGVCQRADVNLSPTGAPWQRITLPLVGPRLPGDVRTLPTAVFAIAVLDANARVELDHIALGDDRVANVLHNGDFSQGLAHWFPLARNYFVPWHIDNFYLELLIEQGAAGLAACALLLASALATLLSARQRESAAAPYLAAGLVSALLVGTVSSLMDTPRVAFLLFFLALMSIQLGTARSDSGTL